MKNYSLLIIVVLQSIVVSGQNTPELKADLPSIIPPSPTVAALMKFEEVPVSNYTGIPDISIPLFSTTANHGLDINIALSYSPSSIKKEENAGYTGLGWSLIAGGTISRTVRDIPDDAYVQPSNFTAKKIGIYHNDGNLAGDNNNYYDMLPLLTSTYSFDREDEAINRFLFEANEKQKFDTKHDLYQFNFMGFTGRFIIEKKPNGTFEVVKLDKSNLIINYNHTDKTFEIKDTKGFRYVFDIKELSSSHSIIISYKIDNSISENFLGDYSNFISAFHLSKIFYNQDLVVAFDYDNTYAEEQTVRSETHNVPVGPELQSLVFSQQQEVICVGGPTSYIPNGVLPLDTFTTKEVSITTKKISQIRVIGRAKIIFETQQGQRIDVNMRNPIACPYLDKITIKNWDNITVVKEYKFNYLFTHKLFLDNIKEGDIANQYSKYQFKYENLDLDYTDFISDYWGYYKLGVYENDCVNYTNRNRDTDKVFCKKDVLKQIIYPTKGSAIFEFEPNTYSYIGDTPIPDDDNQVDYSENFLDNPDNTSTINLTPIILSNNPNDSTGSITYDLGTFTENKTYVFNTSFSGADETNLGFLYLKKTNPSNSSETIVPRGLYTGGCPLELKLEAGYHYDIKFDWGISAPHSLVAIINIDEKTQNSEINKWLYGGGIRIKNIYYTDNDPAELNTQSFPNNYSRKISYNYNFFNDSSKSSGSLVFQKPVMHYQMKRVFNQLGGGPVCHIYDTNESNGEINYEVYSSSNNLSYISTKGSDVGYKNVTVRENGRTEFEYLTPIDYSEEMNSRNVVYPFAPTANFDYRRGLLLKTKKYDENSRVLKETENHYEFEDYSLTTGFTTFYSNLDCPYAGMFTNYDNYRAGVLDPNTYPTGQFLSNGLQIIAGNILNWNARNCGEYVSDFVSYYPMKEAFGWAKLMDTLSKDYFYDSSGNQSQLINSILYTYNPGNMQLATQKSTTSTGLIVENKYYYTINSELDSEPEITTLRNNNMVDTPLKIETFKAGNKISEQKTIYNNWGNTVLLPKFIQTSKGNNSLETRVSFNQYDEYGHPLELQQQNGTKICYIWGYHKTQLVAKLENINYSSIPSNLITSVQMASDTGTEASLISALTALRNHNLLTNAMITTYTYIPLVGVSTITDPKGNKTTYKYDTLGRLVQVKDRDNNILTENEYHYKN